MKVAVYGGTGFVGSYLIDALVAAHHQPVVLVRKGSEPRLNHADECTIVSGDIDDATAVTACLDGADAAIYNIGILREFPAQGITWEALHYQDARRAMDLATETGVKRFVQISSDEVFVGDGAVDDGGAEETLEEQAAAGGGATVEAELELTQVLLEVPAADSAVVGAKQDAAQE